MKPPEIISTTTIDIPEHQILLDFNADNDAIYFYDWWGLVGWNLFKSWVEREELFKRAD